MPDFLKICKLLINSSMRFVKNEFLIPHLEGFGTLAVKITQINKQKKSAYSISLFRQLPSFSLPQEQPSR